MAIIYRVVDMRTPTTEPAEITIEGARSPEDAARQALGIDVMRSGPRKDIAARVYWQPPGQPMTMVRLYGRATG